MTAPPQQTQTRVAVLACMILVAAAVAYTTVTAVSARRASSETAERHIPAQLLSEPRIVFRSLEAGLEQGRLAVVAAAAPDGPRAETNLLCERIAATGEAGVCLQRSSNPLSPFRGVVFDGELAPGGELSLTGIPSRARLSPDSRYAATTAFVSGHSYTAAGFSTETLIHDLGGATPPVNLEDFTFLLNGRPSNTVDLNVWGVTFIPEQPRFFATVRSEGRTYLVEGDLEQRTLVALRTNAECPSLSPDGRHLVYKKRHLGEDTDLWRFQVLDLETGQERPLGEERSVDDQVAWLDAEHVLYGVPRRTAEAAAVDIWMAPIDGGEPELLIPDADSPTVVR